MISWLRNILHRGADDWQRWWDARVSALENILGKCDGTVYHSPPPLHLDGYADVLRFRNYREGVTYVTCDLIGNPKQVPSLWGNYELMMCTREESNWAPALLSRLAKYSHDALVHTGDTMDLAHAVPSNSTMHALLFTHPELTTQTFSVLSKPATLMLCIGITADEFAACKEHSSQMILRSLKHGGVFPYTDPRRESVPMKVA